MGRSLKTRKKEVWIQIGPYHVQERQEGTWKVKSLLSTNGFTLRRVTGISWAVTGKRGNERIQKRLTAPNLEEAIVEAEDLLGITIRMPAEVFTPQTLADKFLDARPVAEKTKSHQYKMALDRFVEWCDRKGIKTYQDLRPSHFEAWLSHCKKTYKGWTVRHYARIVKAMSRWASRDWPDSFRHWADGFAIPAPQKNPLDEEMSALSIGEVLEFLDWLDEQPTGWRIRPVVALCGLAGLGVMEALRLEWKNVDLSAGTVDIRGEVKNSHRIRRIPLPEEVLEVLRRSPQDGTLVSEGGQTRFTYSKAFDRRYLAWRKSLGEVDPPKRSASDLRDVIQSLAEIQGWSGYILNRYVGHAGKSVRQRHYTKISVADLVKEMRTQVVAKIDAAARERRERKEAKRKP